MLLKKNILKESCWTLNVFFSGLTKLPPTSASKTVPSNHQPVVKTEAPAVSTNSTKPTMLQSQGQPSLAGQVQSLPPQSVPRPPPPQIPNVPQQPQQLTPQQQIHQQMLQQVKNLPKLTRFLSYCFLLSLTSRDFCQVRLHVARRRVSFPPGM